MSICDVAVALAGGAAAAVDVEAEMAGRVVVRAGFDRFGEHGANLVERLDVRHRVRARRAADRALIDQHHVVDLPVAEHVVVRQRLGGVLAHPPAERRVERVLHQRALARAADAGHQAQHAQRKLDRRCSCRLLPRAPASRIQPCFGVAALRRDRHAAPARRGSRRSGSAVAFEHLGRRALKHDLAAALAGAGADLDELIGRADHRLLRARRRPPCCRGRAAPRSLRPADRRRADAARPTARRARRAC